MAAEVDVVIVGAGAAGVAAARRLAPSGLSVVLLEASGRVGGRAWTYDVAGLRVDLGCGWLHSADRNSWTAIAEATGFHIDRRRPAWRTQYRDLGFSPAEQAAASKAFADWSQRLIAAPPASDCAADVLGPEERWQAYLQAMSGFISGAGLEQISVADYLAYDKASTGSNWRVVEGYGTLISHAMPRPLDVRLSTPMKSVDLAANGVIVGTPFGAIRARSTILTVSTAMLAGNSMTLPPALDDWRHAASCLPLGRNEKLFFEVNGDDPFAPETQVLGDPRDVRTGAYYIRPLGEPAIECFLGGESARLVEDDGQAAGFAHAIDQLVALFGSNIRRNLRPLVASNWSRMAHIGGAYSHALPGHAGARQELARPFEQRVFFAGEATHAFDFSTAHGAHDSGVRAGDEVIAELLPELS
jgi:monoamine oxidase